MPKITGMINNTIKTKIIINKKFSNDSPFKSLKIILIINIIQINIVTIKKGIKKKFD
jgi:hypothetical protein